jgi:hypothetical protein
MTAKQFLDNKQEEHFKQFGVYADVNSKIAQWMGEFCSLSFFAEIDRLEVINHNSNDLEIGRIFSFRGKMEFSLQDDGKSLKIFI